MQFTQWGYAKAIFISWSIALAEYSLQVPANRLAHVEQGGPFTAPQLKVIAEIFSLTTFAVFSAIVLKERLRWVDLGAFALILAGVLLSLLTKQPTSSDMPSPPPLPAPEPLPIPSPVALPYAEVQIVGRKMLYDASDCSGAANNPESRVYNVEGMSNVSSTNTPVGRVPSTTALESPLPVELKNAQSSGSIERTAVVIDANEDQHGDPLSEARLRRRRDQKLLTSENNA